MAESGESEKNNFRAGIFTITALVLGFATLVVLNGEAVEQLFGKYNRYSVRFDLYDGVSGLNTGSEVRVGGLTRGRVTAIKLEGLNDDPGTEPEAIVEIEVDKKSGHRRKEVEQKFLRTEWEWILQRRHGTKGTMSSRRMSFGFVLPISQRVYVWSN